MKKIDLSFPNKGTTISSDNRFSFQIAMSFNPDSSDLIDPTLTTACL